VPVAPLPLYALLKLVAYTDRKWTKDLDAVDHVLRHYADDDERRWGLEHEGTLVEYDYGPAYLLGIDGARFLGPGLNETRSPLLASLSARSTGKPTHEDDLAWQAAREDLFF
jgi:predicted nucleotidyltransferase